MSVQASCSGRYTMDVTPQTPGVRCSNARVNRIIWCGLGRQSKPRCLILLAHHQHNAPMHEAGSSTAAGRNPTAAQQRLPARVWGLASPGRSREQQEASIVAAAVPTAKQQLPQDRNGKKGESAKRPSGPSEGDDEPETYGFFNLSRYNDPWNVPWGTKTVVGGMALWLAAFVGVGFIGVPYLYKLAGTRRARPKPWAMNDSSQPVSHDTFASMLISSCRLRSLCVSAVVVVSCARWG